jgi:tetrahydromethanopterin S-methyltransferase subunit A
MSESPHIAEAVAQLKEAAGAKKCWPCGCLHSSLAAIERALPGDERPAEMNAALRAGRERLAAVMYECLGCQVCFPAIALNALHKAGVEVEPESCPTTPAEARGGWPPLPGSYIVRRYHAPLAVCTLTDDGLAEAVDRNAGPEVAIVGTLQTENLGIERLIVNVLANPNIRFILVCGEDSRQAIGHLPGQSLVTLARSGLDDRSRIIGAGGKRPVIRNVAREAIEHFRQTVEVVDLVGVADLSEVLHSASDCATRDPGPAEPFSRERVLQPIAGYVTDRLVPDPAGYFVVYVDRLRGLLSLEHHRKDGVLDAVIEGRMAAELYTPAIAKGLLSRLDHAAYLGRELARAERSILTGEPFVQDRAPGDPEPRLNLATYGCATACEPGGTP